MVEYYRVEEVEEYRKVTPSTLVARGSPVKDLIDNWRPNHEVMALRWGPSFLGLLSSYPAMALVRKLSFLNKQIPVRTGSILVAAVPSVMLSGIAQTVFVKYPTLSGESPCPLCMQTRSQGFQLACGVF